MKDKQKKDQELEKQELEDFIQDWYYGEPSHRFVKDLGIYLFQFIDHLYEQDFTEIIPSQFHVSQKGAIT